MRSPRIRGLHVVSGVLFLAGLFLLSANIAGMFTSLKNQEIKNITLDESQVYAVIRENISDRKSYVKKLNDTIYKGIAHYWNDEGIDKYNLRIPFRENYLLFIGSYVAPKYFRKWEFMDYRRAIERGVGLCSQKAIVIAEILNGKGVKTRVVDLSAALAEVTADGSGHVVAAARVDDDRNEWWILDPDYGVVIPHSVAKIEKQIDLIAPYYKERGFDESTIENLMGDYEKQGNLVFDGARNYAFKRYLVEQASYILIWVIPILLMLPLLLYGRLVRRLGTRVNT